MFSYSNYRTLGLYVADNVSFTCDSTVRLSHELFLQLSTAYDGVSFMMRINEH